MPKIEIEKTILSYMMHFPDQLIKCMSMGVLPEMFYDERHGNIYREMLALKDKEAPCDYITLTDSLDSKGIMDSCGGTAYVTELEHEYDPSGRLDSWIRIFITSYALRNLKSSCLRMGHIESDEAEYGKLAQEHVDVCRDALNMIKFKPQVSTAKLIDQSTEMTREMSLNEGKYMVKYHIEGMDSRFSHRKGEKHFLCAQSGTGKTGFVLSVMEAQIRNGVKHVMFCNETQGIDLMNRMKAIHANLPSRCLDKMQDFHVSFLHRYKEASEFLMQNKDVFHIYGQGSYDHSIDGIDAKLKEIRDMGFEPDMVSVDYIQNMKPSHHSQKLHRSQQLEEIAFGLCDVFSRHNVAGLVLAQVNRDKDRDKNSRPMIMADIKGSSAIEQCADYITVLQRQNDDKGCIAMKWYDLKIRGSQTIRLELEFNTDNGKYTKVLT